MHVETSESVIEQTSPCDPCIQVRLSFSATSDRADRATGRNLMGPILGS